MEKEQARIRINELRKITGCGMMECKKALTEANGDMDEAVKVLNKIQRRKHRNYNTTK